MKTSDMRESKFLKQSDVGRGLLVTIARIEQYNVAKEGADPEHKWCFVFTGVEKPLVANSTNLQLCEAIFNSDETDTWIGKQIVLYVDPNVSYQGKLVGGIRIRAPRVAPQPVPQPAQARPATRPAPGPVAPVGFQAPVAEIYPNFEGSPVDDDAIPF